MVALACVQASHRILSDQHPLSHRLAVLEDRGTTLWLYLTERDGSTIACDVRVFNRQELITPAEGAGQEGLPIGGQWAFSWSGDGEAVAVMREGQPVALARATRRIGFSRQVIEAGPWGVPWCEVTFNEIFGLRDDD